MIDAQQQLDDLGREQISLLSQEPETEVVESLPTPLAKIVSGQELHLRLAYGLVAVVPFDELEKELETHLDRNAWRLREQGAMDGTVGPMNGFRLRYRIQLAQVSIPTPNGSNDVRTVPRFRVDFIPTSPPKSASRSTRPCCPPPSSVARSSRFSPTNTTVTIWTYPDSFQAFRQLKNLLFDLGYSSAGRPLPEGVLMGRLADRNAVGGAVAVGELAAS